MFPRTVMMRRLSPSSRVLIHPHIRRYSTQKQPSPTGAFYKTFTRPVAKCVLIAVFVYQLIYFGWTKLETEEIKRDKQAEILRLEAQVKALQAAREAEKAEEAKSAGKTDQGKGSSSWWSWK